MTTDPKHKWLMTGFRPLVRGLSALFWGLPLALVVGMQGLVTDWLRPLGVYPPVFASALLLYGAVLIVRSANLAGIGGRAVRDFAILFAVINLGLSPFLYWWTRLPGLPPGSARRRYSASGRAACGSARDTGRGGAARA